MPAARTRGPAGAEHRAACPGWSATPATAPAPAPRAIRPAGAGPGPPGRQHGRRRRRRRRCRQLVHRRPDLPRLDRAPGRPSTPSPRTATGCPGFSVSASRVASGGGRWTIVPSCEQRAVQLAARPMQLHLHHAGIRPAPSASRSRGHPGPRPVHPGTCGAGGPAIHHRRAAPHRDRPGAQHRPVLLAPDRHVVARLHRRLHLACRGGAGSAPPCRRPGSARPRRPAASRRTARPCRGTPPSWPGRAGRAAPAPLASAAAPSTSTGQQQARAVQQPRFSR